VSKEKCQRKTESSNSNWEQTTAPFEVASNIRSKRFFT